MKTRLVGGATLGLLALFSTLFFPATPSTHAELLAGTTSQESTLHPVEKFVTSSTVSTLQEAFEEAGVEYYPEDKVSIFPGLGLGVSAIVTVERATPVEVKEGKRTLNLRTWQTTVEGLLREKGLELGAEDRISPALTTSLQSGLIVTITRVARTTVTETETIPFQTEEREDPTAYRGQRKVTQEGELGKREKKYELFREDGELKSKTLLSDTVIKKAVNKIISIGTKLKIGEVYQGKATYYENNYGTKVATDMFKRGTELRVTNLNNGKSIIVRNDGCICGAQGVLIDLNPAYFMQLGGTLGQGVLQNVRVEEILP